MKLSGAWIDTPATQSVCAMLADAGHDAYFVGGCVRNAILKRPVGDIDIATDARPDTVIRLAAKAGFNAIPTGVGHGTVTVVAHHIPHEITTFRKDVDTDGRRATVAFSDDLTEDARRRDFTMNALYASADGSVIDPLNGLPDLLTRRVRFIDDAGQRIREDYLRILRFFRFHALYGDPGVGLDEDGLAAVAAHTDGLAGLSRERVTGEMLKLLVAPDPAPSVAAMRVSGVLDKVLPGATDRFLAPLVHIEALSGVAPHDLRRLAILGGDNPTEQLRLSKKQQRQLDLLRAEMATMSSPAALGYHFGEAAGLDILLLRAAVTEQPLETDARAELAKGATSTFPVRADDLMPDLTGAALGARLKELEARWIDSGFKMTRDELLNR